MNILYSHRKNKTRCSLIKKRSDYYSCQHLPKKADKMVVIYARESSNTAEQLKALSSQISKLTQKSSQSPRLEAV